jgi:hypothetical protein
MPALKGTLTKALHSLRWLPAYSWQQLMRGIPGAAPLHLMIAIANHFEPEILPGMPGKYAEPAERQRRVEAWCRDYPKMAETWLDADGRPLRHTYFYPAEHYD